MPTRVADPIYSRHEGEADELCTQLLQQQHRLLGFDIEWKVTYEAGMTQRPTATVQLSTAHCAYVLQISAMRGRFPAALAALLQDGSILKAGCKVGNDALKLRRDFGIRTAGLVELGDLAAHSLLYGERSWNLVDLVAEAAGRRLPKELRMSDWEAAPLSADQLTYASRDAYASRLVCTRLLGKLKTKAAQLQTSSKGQMGCATTSTHGQHGGERLGGDAELLSYMPTGLVENTPVDPMTCRHAPESANGVAVAATTKPSIAHGQQASTEDAPQEPVPDDAEAIKPHVGVCKGSTTEQVQ